MSSARRSSVSPASRWSRSRVRRGTTRRRSPTPTCSSNHLAELLRRDLARRTTASRRSTAACRSATNGANNSRARAFAKFMQGVAHGYLALMYDKAVIIDETRERRHAGHADVLAVSQDVMAAAIAMLKASIAISDTATFTLPTVGWIPGLAYHEQGSVAARAHVHRALRGVRRAHAGRTRGSELGRRHRAGRRGHHGGLRADRFSRPVSRTTTSRSRRACARSRATTCAAAIGSSVRPIPPTDGRTGSRRRSRIASRSRCARRIAASSARRVRPTAGHVLRVRAQHRVLQSDARHLSPDVLLLSALRRRHDVNNGPLVAIGRTEMDMLKAEALDPSQSRGRSGSAHQQDARRERQASDRRHQRTARCRRVRAAKDDRRVRQTVGRAALRKAHRRRGRRRSGRVLGRTRMEHARRELVRPVPDSRRASSRSSGCRSTRTAAAAQGSAPTPTWDKCPAGVTLPRCS